jgi:MarR family transcriptional regulator, temperature-dependent positive regulator of motility
MPPKRAASSQPAEGVDPVDMDLYEQPGHLIRRAHQIANGMFKDLVGPDVTPVQYAILRMIHERPGIDQVSLAKHIALDTSTTALTAARLEDKGLLHRSTAAADRRVLCLSLTAEGESLLTELVAGVHLMREKLLGALDDTERKTFMRLLRKFVHVNNEQSPAPLDRAVVARKSAAAVPPPVTRRARAPARAR